MSLFGVFWTYPALRGDILADIWASFLQVEFVGGWSATELSPMHCQVRSGPGVCLVVFGGF